MGERTARAQQRCWIVVEDPRSTTFPVRETYAPGDPVLRQLRDKGWEVVRIYRAPQPESHWAGACADGQTPVEAGMPWSIEDYQEAFAAPGEGA